MLCMLSKMIHKYTTTIEYLHIPRTRTNAPKQGGLCGFIGVVKNLYELLHFKYLLSYLKKSKNLKNLVFRSIARSRTGDQIMRLIMTDQWQRRSLEGGRSCLVGGQRWVSLLKPVFLDNLYSAKITKTLNFPNTFHHSKKKYIDGSLYGPVVDLGQGPK